MRHLLQTRRNEAREADDVCLVLACRVEERRGVRPRVALGLHALRSAAAERRAAGEAVLVGCAGCYPTATQLGFLPLLEAGLADTSRLIADCKSGVSGAGRKSFRDMKFYRRRKRWLA